jgi:hypothetical protein
MAAENKHMAADFSLRNSFLSFTLFTLIGSLSGCITIPTRNALYPDFYNQSEHLKVIRIVADFIAVKDSYSGQYIDIPETIDGGAQILKEINKGLKKIGFSPVRADTVCSGCLIDNSTVTFHVLTKNQAVTKTVEELPRLPAPFYINPLYAADAERSDSLKAHLHKLVRHWKKTPSTKNEIDPDLKYFRSDLKEDAVLFVTGAWIEMTRWKSIGSMVVPAVISGVIFGMPVLDADRRPLKLNFYMVDMNTGEIVWTDGVVALIPNMIDEGPMLHMQKILVERIPMHKSRREMNNLP